MRGDILSGGEKHEINPPKSGVFIEGEKARTSIRMVYEAQAEVIRQQIGGLEGARNKLGLSQRKMAQLLLVDPSAWNRWIKNEKSTPPSVFRSIQWYLALNEKIPGLSPYYFIGKDPAHIEKALSSAMDSIRAEKEIRHFENGEFKGFQNELKTSVRTLEAKVLRLRNLLWISLVGFFISTTMVFIFVFQFYLKK